ncbi:MarR family winged helix-turn-helix transcriptional regulator [Enterococcus thailandicus]|uniref:MarR family winged helix-turn-helix transcriptional regulator n=1 Tax=Enterococcus TaxID=1350 RepID=UPI0022DF2C2D|nr:MarR family transcriptional regulator [Enterococcus thailandicus]
MPINIKIKKIDKKTKKSWNHQNSFDFLRATQTDIMMFALKNPHQIQKDIARRMAIDPSLLTKDLKFLEKEEIITRSLSNESRAYHVDLTDKGKKIAEQLGNEMEEWWISFFHTHPEINQAQFTEQLKLVYEAFNANE